MVLLYRELEQQIESPSFQIILQHYRQLLMYDEIRLYVLSHQLYPHLREYRFQEKLKEINNKMDSFLLDTFKPDELSEPQKDVIEDISENDKESNVDLSGVDLSQNLDTIKE